MELAIKLESSTGTPPHDNQLSPELSKLIDNLRHPKDTPEFKELEATIGRLHELVDALGYGYSSYNDERGHVIEVVKVVGEFVGTESLEAFKLAVEELEKMGTK